ncbi:MAG TPA: hypothetical protein VF575_05245 [Candidatus Saccharimonadales bacterium]
MKAPETYEIPRSTLLGEEIMKLLQPSTVVEFESALRRDGELEYRESVCRLVDTDRFMGCVAVEYYNEDFALNPGYERGTRKTLVIAGVVEGDMVSYKKSDYVEPNLGVIHLKHVEIAMEEVIQSLHDHLATLE